MMKPIAFALLVFLAAAALALAEDAPLRVNMILPDGRVLVYAGSKDGVKKGDVYEVRRDGKAVAKVEITEALDFASYGKVTDITGEFKELDTLAPSDAKGKGDEKADKEKEEKSEKDEAKEKKKKEKEEKDAKKKEEKEKEKEDEEKAAKKDEEKIEKTEEKPAGPKIRKGVEYELPSHYGTTGVMMMPSAHKLPKGRAAVALSHISLERVDSASGTSALDSSQNSFAIAYGLDDNIEVAYYHASDQSIGMSGAGPLSSEDTDVYMLKYQFGKRYMYKDDSVKNVRYAAELARYIVEDDEDMTRITGLFSYHHPNFATHLGLYKLTGREIKERDTGLMVGLELPMGKEELSLIGQFDLFRKDSFYAAGARYEYHRRGTIEAGILGMNYDKAFMVSLGHIF